MADTVMDQIGNAQAGAVAAESHDDGGGGEMERADLRYFAVAAAAADGMLLLLQAVPHCLCSCCQARKARLHRIVSFHHQTPCWVAGILGQSASQLLKQ